jgi:integrase
VRRRGHIARKNGRFYAVVDLGRNELSGKRQRRWSGGFAIEAAADAELVRLLHALDQGDSIDPTKLTVERYLLDRWLPIVAGNLSPTTLREYRVSVLAYIVPHIGHLRLDRVDATTIDRLYLKLRREGGRGGRPLAAKTVRNVHGVLSAAFGFAVRKGLLNRNPVKLAETPETGRPDTAQPWSAEELRAFINHVAGDRLEALWWLIPFTGMRRSEAIGLGWDDVDEERTTVAVTHTVVDAEDGPIRRSDTKTKRSRRSISLDADTLRKLREHRRHQFEERMAVGDGYEDYGLVFCRQDGSMLRPDWVSRRFARLRDEAGLRRITLRDLRHVWATLALESGIHPKVVQERLGHSSIMMTLDQYSHVIEGLDQQAADTVAAVVLRPSTQSSTQPPIIGRDES